MKVIFMAALAMLAILVVAAPAVEDTELSTNSGRHPDSRDAADSNNNVTPKDLNELRALRDAAIMHDATVPEPPTKIDTATGPRDTCMISCDDSFIKSFDCWWYNNTRCWSCSLSSDSDWCRGNCKCLTISRADAASAGVPQSFSLTSAAFLGLDRGNITESKQREPDHDSAHPSTAPTNKGNDSDGYIPRLPWALSCYNGTNTESCYAKGSYCNTSQVIGPDETCNENCHCFRESNLLPPLDNAPTPTKRIFRSYDMDGWVPDCLSPDKTANCRLHDVRCDSGGHIINPFTDRCQDCSCVPLASRGSDEYELPHVSLQSRVDTASDLKPVPKGGSEARTEVCKKDSTVCDGKGNS